MTSAAGKDFAITRTLPLTLTAGGPPGRWTTTSGGLRHRFQVPVEVGRWRVHLLDVNPRFGHPRRSTVTVRGVWVGDEGTTPGGWSVAPRQVVTVATRTPPGDSWTSRWIEHRLPPGAWQTLGLAWLSSEEPETTRTKAWTTTLAGASSPDAATRPTSAPPFDVWLECDVPPHVPAVAVVGDSLSVGVGSSFGIADAWPSVAARGQSIWPVVMGHSGDGLLGWDKGHEYGWSRFAATTPPDSAVLALGSNDIAAAASLDALKARARTVAALMRQRLTPDVRAATVLPRTNWSTTARSTQQSFNKWLKDGGLDAPVLDIAPAISSDAITVDEAFDSGDGTHLNSDGYAAIAQSVSLGLPGRETAAHPHAAVPESGLRELSHLLDSIMSVHKGRLHAWRIGPTVHVMIGGLVLDEDLDRDSVILPVGFRPDIEHVVAVPTTRPDQTGRASISPDGVLRLRGVVAAGEVAVSTSFPTSTPFPSRPYPGQPG